MASKMHTYCTNVHSLKMFHITWIIKKKVLIKQNCFHRENIFMAWIIAEWEMIRIYDENIVIDLFWYHLGLYFWHFVSCRLFCSFPLSGWCKNIFSNVRNNMALIYIGLQYFKVIASRRNATFLGIKDLNLWHMQKKNKASAVNLSLSFLWYHGSSFVWEIMHTALENP